MNDQAQRNLRAKRDAARAYAEHDKRNAQAVKAEKKALDRLNDLAALPDAEKRAETQRRSLEAVAEHEQRQREFVESEAEKAAAGPDTNKSARPVKENKAAPAKDADDDAPDADALDGVPLTDAAERKARELGMVAEDFKRRRKSGNAGQFTVDDVERIHADKSADD